MLRSARDFSEIVEVGKLWKDYRREIVEQTN